MTLRARLRLIWLLTTAAVTALSYVLARASGRDPVKVALVVLIPLFVALVLAQVVLVGRLQKRLRVALERKDVAALRRGIADLADFFRGQRGLSSFLTLQEGRILLSQERYAEARGVLESIDRSVLDARARPSLLASLALCLAHLGEAEHAVALAREAIADRSAAAETNGDNEAAEYEGILGAAQVMAGQPEAAIESLEQSLARGSAQPGWQAMRAFYLGEALRAASRTTDATRAYERAAQAAPESAWARRARERLGQG